MQAEKNGIGAHLSAKTAFAELDVGAPIVIFDGVADLDPLAAAALEDAQHIARLGNFPALQRIEKRQHPFAASFLGRGRRPGLNALRLAINTVALAKMRVLVGKRSVVVQRRAPQERARRHHAGANFADFIHVASGRAAASRRYA